jgi:probable HAF family extracellular repeat protein
LRIADAQGGENQASPAYKEKSMKTRAFSTLTCIVARTLLPAVLEIPVRLAAQDTESQNHAHKHVRYTVKVLSTLGGTSGVGNSVNNRGWVTGATNLTGDTTEHAALWRNGVITDLGTLGGPDSFINAPVKNERGEIEGFAETSTPDPLGEAFCTGVTFFGFQDGVTCLGFLWREGVMAPLPPLAGGNNSQASGVNNRGQVVGFAENGTQDVSCTPPQVLQFEAVIWGPKKGQIQQLPALSGDSDGIGVAINDEGEVTGCSGVCANVGGASCTHAVVWKDGSPRDIGGLGPLNLGAGINSRGQVLGLSLLPDGTTFHSFVWQKGVITDLGTLPGHPLTFPGGLNSKGQVVGHSCDATDTFCVAYIWEDGVMTDLNTLIPRGSSVSLFYAGDINDRGEIAGIAVDPVTGAGPAFLAIPCDEEHGYPEGCEDEAEGGSAAQGTRERPREAPPESVRSQLQQRLGLGRFVTGMTKAK